MADYRPSMDIAQLVAEHHQAVYAYAFRLCGSEPDAEDLTQQVFLVAQQKLGQLRNIESARAWLFAILRRRFLKNCRRRQPLPAASLKLNIDALPAEIPPADQIDRERLQDALNILPADFRVVLLMFYFEHCSYREIADQLDLPLGTVMSRLARAKGHLRSILFELESSAAGKTPTRPGR